jgi:diphthamide biosynthesis protein 7
MNTDLHPCTIESIPCLGHKNLPVFACGSYELDEMSSNRKGNVSIFGFLDSTFKNFDILHREECSGGVLDIKISNLKLGLALSSETVEIYKIHNNGKIEKEFTGSKNNEGLFLSLNWDSNPIDDCFRIDEKIAVSTQNSSIIVYTKELNELNHIQNAHVMMAEPMPVWTVAFNFHSKITLLSGGDDCKFKLWDLRTINSSSTTSTTTTSTFYAKPIAVSSHHNAGVTSAMWHPYHPNVFATGFLIFYNFFFFFFFLQI